jgi:hypothetical protein
MAFCSSCGANIPSGSGFCNSCGQSVTPQATTTSAAAAQPARIAEQAFFKSDDVLVTNTRLVKGNETFAMSGVTSVRAHTEVPSKKGPIIVMVVGVLVLLGSLRASLGGALVGVALIGLGIWWFRSIKNIHYVRLVTASGERDAIGNVDGEYIAKIVAAISQAIIHRG